jgi:hypothetical protein
MKKKEREGLGGRGGRDKKARLMHHLKGQMGSFSNKLPILPIVEVLGLKLWSPTIIAKKPKL